MAAALLFSYFPLSTVLATEAATTVGVTETTETEKYMQIDDGYLKVTVSKKNGGFLVDTVMGDKTEKADDNKHLLYPSEDFDTSFTSVRITRTSGKTEEYIFGRSYGFLGLNSSKTQVEAVGNGIVATWSIKDVTIEQRIALLDESATQHGMVSISYGFTTESSDVAGVDVRVLMDTSLGTQDYAVYQIQNIRGEYDQIERETVLDDTNGAPFYGTMISVDDAKTPKLTAYTVNAAVNGQTLSPSKVAIGHWNNLAATVFDFVPDPTLTFTNPYNEQFMTADSAYALYYSLGALEAGVKKEMSTYYGVYSNATVDGTERAAVNFQQLPASMTLNETKDAYLSQVENGKAGDVKFDFSVKNLTDYAVKSMVVVIQTQNMVTPYQSFHDDLLYDEESLDDFYLVVEDFQPGEVAPLEAYFNIKPLQASEYRRFRILCYEAKEGDILTEENLLGSRECYVLCPGALGDVVTFSSIEPQMIYTEGTRHIYLSGQNFAKLSRPSEYTTILRPLGGGRDVVIPATNVIVDTERNSMHLVVDRSLAAGTYQVVFDWIETGKEDTTSEMLRIGVTDSPKYISPTYGIVTIEKAPDYETSTSYRLMSYLDENAYKQQMKDPNNWVLLEFRGDFSLIYDEMGTVVGASAVSIADVEGKVTSTINISDCLDVEAGRLDIEVENPGAEDQAIHVNIDGRVYTTNSRTKVWDGVCAITSFENGSESTLLQYDAEGDPTTNVENSVANTNAITLLWPGAAGTAQTIAGIIMEFRYAQFGMMALEEGTVTDSTPKRRVVAFGAQMSPDFLFPRNFDWSERETSTMEAVQLKLAKSNYTAEQLRDVQRRYAADQAAWEEAESVSLTLYVHDILFGGGFVGFHAAVDVEIPSYADGLPGIEGTLDLHIMPINKKWAVGVSGSADFGFVQMEATLALKSYNYIPIVDTLYFYIGGVTPGLNVDGMGIFWIRGLGGGIDNLYESLFIASVIPPITLSLSGEFALFALLEARADLGLSLRGFDVSLSNIGVSGITLIDYVGLSAYWYPKLRVNAGLEVNILDVIEGGGYLLVEERTDDGSIFWEGFVTATVKIPDIFPIGSITIGSADLGVNTSKIWGALHVLGTDMSLTYYWGGDVDFAFGKYDATEPTMPLDYSPMMLLADVPVYEDPQTGEILYMRTGSNASISAVPVSDSYRAFALSANPSIVSGSDKTYHTIGLGPYISTQDQVLSVTFKAGSEYDAETIAKTMTLLNDNGESYSLKWFDKSKMADDPANADANALWLYDSETGDGNVVISFTQESAYAGEWKLASRMPCDPVLYVMKHIPGLVEEFVQYTVDASGDMTVTWSGDQLDKIETLSVYAIATDGTPYLLHEIDNANGTALCNDPLGDPENGKVTFPIAERLPSGDYTVQVIASGEKWSVNDNINAKNTTGGLTFKWENPSQPKAPTIKDATFGGDYTLELTVSPAEGEAYDGYIATIYEKAEDGSFKATEFAEQQIKADKDAIEQTLTLGGRYTTTVTVDENDNPVLPGTEGALTKEIAYGLEAGKIYRVGVRGYREAESGEIYASAEVKMADAFAPMPESDPATLEIAANGAVKVNDELAPDGLGTVDTVNLAALGTDDDGDKTVIVTVTSNQKIVSGTWMLDGGVEEGTWRAESGAPAEIVLHGKNGDALSDEIDDGGLTEGEHTITVIGRNENGDACSETYRFRVDATAPSLFVSGPYSGSFFGNTEAMAGGTFFGTVITGISEPGARISASAGGAESVETMADADGSFALEVSMNPAAIEEDVVFYAVDAAGNKSRAYTVKLVNELVSASDVELAIFSDGANVTSKMLAAGAISNLELRFVSGDQSVVIPMDSDIGRQAEWNLVVVSGEVSLENGTLTANDEADGMIRVTLDKNEVSAGIGGTDLSGGFVNVTLPAPDAVKGYEVTSEYPETILRGESYVFRVKIKNGYSKTSAFAVKVNGAEIEAQPDGSYRIDDINADKTITVEGIADITAPAITMKINDKTFQSFLNNITFGLVFQSRQAVEITATDEGSGVVSVSYYVSEQALTATQVKALDSEKWTPYTKKFYIDPDKRCVVYAKAQDADGNIAWVSSNGLVIDSYNPVLIGVTDGDVLYGDQTFMVSEDNLRSVKVDGFEVAVTNNRFTVRADNKYHTIEIVDMAGNTTRVTVMIKPSWTPPYSPGGSTSTTTRPPVVTTETTTSSEPTATTESSEITATTAISDTTETTETTAEAGSSETTATTQTSSTRESMDASVTTESSQSTETTISGEPGADGAIIVWIVIGVLIAGAIGFSVVVLLSKKKKG